jgi:hypothetical protein
VRIHIVHAHWFHFTLLDAARVIKQSHAVAQYVKHREMHTTFPSFSHTNCARAWCALRVRCHSITAAGLESWYKNGQPECSAQENRTKKQRAVVVLHVNKFRSRRTGSPWKQFIRTCTELVHIQHVYDTLRNSFSLALFRLSRGENTETPLPRLGNAPRTLGHLRLKKIKYLCSGLSNSLII